MKECTNCLKEKELTEFQVNTATKDGVSPWCKECKKEYDLEYRKTDKVQDHYKSEKYRKKKKEYQQWRLLTDPRKQMYSIARLRARKLKLPFNITYEDIYIPEYCPILNIKLKRKDYEEGNRHSWINSSPSLDKIIPELGYVKGNIAVISMKANSMKTNASIEQLELFSKNIMKYINDNSNQINITTISNSAIMES